MQIRLSQIEVLWGCPASGALADPGALLSAISSDSRQLTPGSLFVPLVGEHFDGHRFLGAAIEAGVAALLADPTRLPAAELAAITTQAQQHRCALWLVDDTLVAYQQLARLWRQQLIAPVVAVTGSAGKTTTRELIRAVLRPLGPVEASSGNNNNDIGVPLTLLDTHGEHRALVVEMGMRGLGEIERLSRCALPDVAVITNIGTAHIGRLGSREAIAQAKCEITAGLNSDGLVVIPAGDPLLDRALARVWAGRVMRIALADDPGSAQADWVGVLNAADGTLQLDLLLDGQRLPLPLEGRHHARNLMLALAVARELGLAVGSLGPISVELPGGRSRRLQIAGVTVLDETYNASPEAVLASLELLQRHPSGRRFAVLGTMLELGEHSVALHHQVARKAVDLDLDGLVIVATGAEGDTMLAAATGLRQLVRVDSPSDAVAPLSNWLQPGDALLLKASRGVALERLLPLLELELGQGAGPTQQSRQVGAP